MKYQKTFRHISAVALAAAFLSAIIFTTVASGQSKVALQGGSPAMNWSRELLKRADVQNELGLDAQQKEGVAKMVRSQLQIIVVPIVKPQDISKLSDQERKQLSAEMGRQASEQTACIMNEQQKREMEEVLRPDQRERLTEIDLQWRGVLALRDRSLSDRLGVSPEHQDRIADILAEFFVERRPLLDPNEVSETTNSPRYQKRQALLQETEQKVLSLLSNAEKARWVQATAKPFKFED